MKIMKIIIAITLFTGAILLQNYNTYGLDRNFDLTDIVSSQSLFDDSNDILSFSNFNASLNNEVSCQCSSNWNPFGNNKCLASNAGATCNTTNTSNCQSQNSNCGGKNRELELEVGG
ncbi:MAG: hypothetical protein LAT67_13795 [Balneolales bacterium]|nr:hypothetical protein [Balneolales bacterium]